MFSCENKEYANAYERSLCNKNDNGWRNKFMNNFNAEIIATPGKPEDFYFLFLYVNFLDRR